MAEIKIPNTKPSLPLLSGNVSSLVSSNTLNTLSKSTFPTTFGDQIPKIAAQQILVAATKSKLANLYKEKVSLILKEKKLNIQHQITLSNLEQKRTPKKQIVNGQEKDIPAELTEEEYQTALIIEKGTKKYIEEGGISPGTLNGQQVKGNYPTAKENLDKLKKDNQKQIDDILKDPFKSQKDQLKKLKSELNNREKKTKAERREARKKKTKSVLRGAKATKSLVPIITLSLVNRIAAIIAQNDRIGKLVDDTNTIITEANLSNNPVKLQNAKLARDNAIRIITDNENKIRKINDSIKIISTIITIFNIIANIIGPVIFSIPVPSPAPDVVTTTKEIFRKKVYEPAIRILNGITAYLPTIILSLEKAIQILNDYKSQLLNINETIDRASLESENPNDFLSSPVGTVTDANNSGNTENSDLFPEYKGFKFALREENNPKFVVRGYKRRYAVAINKAGVEVLKSELSFTLDPNDLIEQLKLLINQQNLSADSSSPFGSSSTRGEIGGLGGTTETTNNTQPRFLIPSSSTISTVKKTIFTPPPQPKEVVGPSKILKEKVPLSPIQKAKLAAILALPLPPPPATALAIATKTDATFIFNEDRKWKAASKKYMNQIDKAVSKLES